MPDLKLKFEVDLDRDVLIVNWDSKSIEAERAFHDIGGQFEDFDSYRFGLTAPNIRATVRAARTLGKVRFTPEAKQTFNTLLERDKAVVGLSKGSADAEIPELLMSEYPETAKSLRPYQRAGIKFMMANQYTLLADEPGAGKTLSTIATIVASGVTGDILVLSPSIATQVVWPAEIKHWAPNDEILHVTGARSKREAELAKLRFFSGKSKRRWVLCNLEMVKIKYHEPVVIDGKERRGWYEHQYPELFFNDFFKERKDRKVPREWAAIVVDESHRALITNKTKAHMQTQIRCGFGKLATKPDGKRIAISGTPFRGKLENLWGTLNWLDPQKYSVYWKWVSDWFDTEQVSYGGARDATKINELTPEKRTQFFEHMAPFTLRRTKKEIAKDLPDKVYAGTLPDNFEGDLTDEERVGLVGHWLDMEPKQKRAYLEMEEDAIAYLDSGAVVANSVLATMTRLKQFAGCYGKIEQREDSDGLEIDIFKPVLPSNKFNWLLEFLEELGIDKEGQEGPEARKVVIASQFTSVIDVFDAALQKKGIKTLKVTGKVKAKDRQHAAEVFQTDTGPQVFLLNTTAGGVALTLDRADDIVILDETFIPDDQSQVEDRVHRVSRNHNVTVHYVRSKGTIEEKIAKTTFNRDQIQKQILDGERGVDFARKILTTN